MSKPGTNSGGGRLDWAVFALLSACVLVPIWIVQYPPLQDYWNHLLKARILAEYSDASLRYSQYYGLSALPIPNSASTVIIALLMKVFSPGAAGKLFLSLYALMLPLSVRYLVRCAGGRIRSLELVGFGMVYNPCFWAGFIDSCLGTALALFAVGYWIKTRKEASGATAARFGALTLLTYFTHFWAVAILLGTTLMLSLWESKSRRLMWLAAAGVIGVLFVVYSAGADERHTIEYWGFTFTLSILRNTLSLPRLLGVDTTTAQDGGLAALMALRLALILWLVLMAWKRKTPLFYVACCLMLIYLVLPSQFGRMYEPGQRTLVFVPAFLAAAVSVELKAKQRMYLYALVVLACLLPVLLTGYAWLRKDSDLRTYHQVLAHIPAQKNVLYVCTLPEPRFPGLAKLLASDLFTPERFFGAEYNVEGGGYYVNTFTTGIVKVRANPTPVAPMFFMDGKFTWPGWLRRNLRLVKNGFDYIVIAGPPNSVQNLLRRDYCVCYAKGYVQLMHNRSAVIATKH